MICKNIHILPRLSRGEKEKKNKNRVRRREETGLKQELYPFVHSVIFSYLGQGGFTASQMRSYPTSPGFFSPYNVLGEMPKSFSSRFCGGLPL
jgi:hypothetical protein